MPDSSEESQKPNLSKFRPHGLVGQPERQPLITQTIYFSWPRPRRRRATKGLTLSPDAGAFIGSELALQDSAISGGFPGLLMGKMDTAACDYSDAQKRDFARATARGPGNGLRFGLPP